MANKPQFQAGFTLVETLIALSIFALIALGGVGLLNITLTSQDRLDAAAQESRQLQRLQAILRADFGQMIERQSRSTDGNWTVSLGAERQGQLLEFARLGRMTDPDAPATQLEKVRYRLFGGALQRGAFDYADGAKEAPAITLLEQVEAARLRVFRAGRWVELEGTSIVGTLPQGIELQLTHQVLGELTLRYLTPGPTLSAPRNAAGIT